MIENNRLQHIIESQIKSEHLSIPSKTILLEEGKIAQKLYLIRKGCLRLFFYNEGKDITFQFFFEGDFVASFDSLYRRTPSLFFWKVSNRQRYRLSKETIFTTSSSIIPCFDSSMKKGSSTVFIPISNCSCRE